MKKKQSVKRLKALVWEQFSLFIRRRGMDWKEENQCVTCGVRKHYKELQAGHFISGRRNNNLFEEKAVWPQCYRCNVGLKGNVIPYYRFMRDKFGEAVIDELIAQDRQNKQFTTTELQVLLLHYKQLNEKN